MKRNWKNKGQCSQNSELASYFTFVIEAESSQCSRTAHIYNGLWEVFFPDPIHINRNKKEEEDKGTFEKAMNNSWSIVNYAIKSATAYNTLL